MTTSSRAVRGSEESEGATAHSEEEARAAERLRASVDGVLGSIRADSSYPVNAQVLLAAIVAGLGITPEMVEHYATDPCPTCARTRDALSTLLRASGRQP